VNLAGAPALTAPEFADFRPKTVVGASFQIIAPLGHYEKAKLVNLGSNRWTFRAQVGASRTAGPWIVEGYVGGWFFTDNTEFLGNLSRRQKPLWTTKVHLIRVTREGRWLALDVGYGIGGRATVEGRETDTRISAFRFGLTAAVPVAPRHTLRIVCMGCCTRSRGLRPKR
jgi:hypothetical protein